MELFSAGASGAISLRLKVRAVPEAPPEPEENGPAPSGAPGGALALPRCPAAPSLPRRPARGRTRFCGLQGGEEVLFTAGLRVGSGVELATAVSLDSSAPCGAFPR